MCNDLLGKLCHSRKLGFVNPWKNLLKERGMFSRDGIHLTQKGKIVLSGEISNTVNELGCMGNL